MHGKYSPVTGSASDDHHSLALLKEAVMTIAQA
jgi:hypothetical protein